MRDNDRQDYPENPPPTGQNLGKKTLVSLYSVVRLDLATKKNVAAPGNAKTCNMLKALSGAGSERSIALQVRVSRLADPAKGVSFSVAGLHPQQGAMSWPAWKQTGCALLARRREVFYREPQEQSSKVDVSVWPAIRALWKCNGGTQCVVALSSKRVAKRGRSTPRRALLSLNFRAASARAVGVEE